MDEEIIEKKLQELLTESIDNGVVITKKLASLKKQDSILINSNDHLQHLFNLVDATNYSIQGFYKKSQFIYHQILPYYMQQKESEALYIIYRNLGYSYFDESNYALAFENYYNAFRSTTDNNEIGNICLDMAEVYNDLKIEKETLTFLDLAKENYLKTQNTDYLNYVYLGYYAINVDPYKDAQSINPIIQFLIDEEDYENLNFAYFNKAKRFIKTQKDSALFYTNKSLELAKEVNSQPYLILSDLLLSRIQLTNNELNSAETTLKSLKLKVQKIGLNSYLEYIYHEMATLYQRKENFKLSNNYYRLKDSIVSLNKSSIQLKSIADIRLKDEISFKNGEIQNQITSKNTWILIAIACFLLFLILTQSVIHIYNKKKLRTENSLSKEKEINEMRTKFLGNISHEIRTPLTLISGNIQLAIEESQKNKKIKSYLNSALSNSQKVIEDANEILEILKFEKNKQQIYRDNIAIDSFCKRIFLSFESIANNKQIVLEYRSSISDTIMLEIDSKKVEKIINNLLTNALKFSPSNSKIICSVSAENENLKIEITDFGIGINPEEKEKIFERFYQSRKTKSVGGIGIGLALSKEFAALLKGELNVESTVDKGSTFTLLLPFIEITAPVDNELDEKNKNEKNLLPKILIVEDHPEMSKFLAEILGKYYRCSTAFDGSEAYTKIKKEDFDLITSDVMMPKVDGFELREQINTLEDKKNIPFIFITAKSLALDKIKGFDLGISDYIVKPFNKNELLARISNLIKNKKNRDLWKLENNDLFEKNDSFDTKLIEKVKNVIVNNITNEDFKIESIAKEIGYSKRQLARLLKQYTGMSLWFKPK